ncbi:MAG TPA: methyltransferase, TIGR04325 family [Candidatus Didemnitutus sp.]|jgi:putative methyltransferase (TIGR04325 family)
MRALAKRVATTWHFPAIRHRLRLAFGWSWFRGRYGTWAEARAASAGYDDDGLLARVRYATREVRAGRALWERDGTTFDRPEFNEPLLAAMLRIATENNGRLDVVDFGGGLGGTWWQHRAALTGAAGVRWRVVEQPHFVAAGREFADDTLSFHESVSAALAGGTPSAILLSSVLPYLESPDALLAEVIARKFRHVIIDRTPFVRRGGTRLAVQHTPPGLGGGSYPVWLFERGQLLAPLAAHYELRHEWPALDSLALGVKHRGLHFRAKDT